MKALLIVLAFPVLVMAPAFSQASVNCVSPTALTLNIDNSNPAAVTATLARRAQVYENIATKQVTAFTSDAKGISFKANAADGSGPLLDFSATANAQGVYFGALHYKHYTIMFRCW